MDRQRWKDLLEATGFLAIIGSLYFVGIETQNGAIQTQLNTQAVEIAAYQELISNISNMNVLSIQDEDVAAIMLAMRDRPNGDIDAQRLTSAFYLQFRHGDMAYFMYERGVIDEDRLRSTLRPLPLSGETGIEFWSRHKTNFVPGFQQYIDQLMEERFWN